jgi:hypothetical protein
MRWPQTGLKSPINIATIFATFAFAAHAFAGDEAAPPFELKGPMGRLSQTFNGSLVRIRGLPNAQERFDAEVEESAGNTIWGAKVLPWTWVRWQDNIGGEPRKTRGYFELKEGWVEYAAPAWEARVGNQILAWGAADQANPTDVWNPRDLYDPFQSYKLPIFAARARIHPPELEHFTLELIATPFFKESRLPVTLPDTDNVPVPLQSTRWLISTPSTAIAGDFGAPLFYQISKPSYPTSWQAGARLNVLRVGGWDFSASYYNGVENLPRIAITSQGNTNDPSLPVTLTLHPSFHREQMFGADGAGSFKLFDREFGVRFEAAYFKRDNSRALSAPPEFQAQLVKDDYVHAVAGLDHTFPKKFLGTVVYANLQWVFYRRIEGIEERAGQGIIDGLPNVLPWDSDLVVYIEDRIEPSFKITWSSVYSAQNGDAYLSPGVQYQMTDNLKAALTADFFVGSLTGFYGQFQDNRRVNFLTSYSF